MKKLGLLLFVILLVLYSCMNKVHDVKNLSGIEADSLYYPLDSIPADSSMIHVCSSEDGKMKFYCWDTEEGGTIPAFGVLLQIRTKNGCSKVIDMYDGPWFDKVHSITRDDGVTYYITTAIHRSSSSHGYISLWGYMIEGDSVKMVSPIDGGDDLDNCTLEFEYNINDWHHRTMGEGWNWLFEYDAESQNLYVPIVRYDEGYVSKFTDRYRVLHFDGMTFMEVGFEAHNGLHESLRDYNYLARYCRTKDYIIRIDCLEGGSLRFALWKLPATTADEPTVMIFGGKYNKQAETYYFLNCDTEYVLGRDDEYLMDEDSQPFMEYLYVKRNKQTVQKQDIIEPL